MKIVFGISAVLMLLLSTTSVKAESLLHSKIKGKGCYECHRNDEKFIGPSFAEISQRYGGKTTTPALIDYLAKKIINGGLGAWGNTPMNSNPQVSVAEAKEIVKLVLKLKQ